MHNERGGVISKLFFIPIAAACLAGVFFLGYYAGKRQAKSNRDEIVVPLPEVVSETVPTTSDFTFFKTLSDKDNRTVSIELKPKHGAEAPPVPDKSKTQEAAAPSPPPAVPKKQPVGKEAVKKELVKKEPARKEVATARPQSGKVRYTLQTASYQDKAIAERDVKSLKQRGYAAFIVSSDLPGKGTWYRVRLGSFASRGSAERLQNDLRSKEGKSSVILIE